MATYADRFTADALTGKDVGIIFGIIHEGLTPTGEVNDSNKDYVVDPDDYGPFYPRESYAKDFVSTKDDVTIYDDGVACEISAWDEETGTASLSAAPAAGSTMTADVVEQQELYIAQNATLSPKQETDTLDQLRNPTQRQSYGNIEYTLKADFKIADLETLKLVFDPTATPGKYEFPDEPPEIYCAILIEEAGSLQGIIYCENVRANFGDILSAKAGKDAVENGFELTFGTAPILIDVSETA